ncbi:MAG: eukaryotic-like serine/threonine-protein kinase [Bryobacterales bacterium]|jgi:serine/threonine protein kinase|nr:eukaryotic-like serine/threonine-protein kinase [Bryobacterales bacterium]
MIGQTISHYEVLEELGRGGMGIVYKARDTHLDRVLALKLLRGESILPTRVRRFIQEAKSASSLNHPNIVTIYEIFHVGEAPCIAMEYVTGETLEQRLARGPLEFRKGLDWGIAMADALARAHAAGIVHRDVKPSNIMIAANEQVKVLDFGLAKLTQVEESDPRECLTQDGRIVGSPPYISPEQAKGEMVDARSDIFSLGCVIYEMFTGNRPFERDSNGEMLSAVIRDQPKKLRSIAKDLPPRLEELVAQCLEKRVERRYQRMEDVRDELESLRQTATMEGLLAARSARPFWQLWKIWSAAGLLAAVVVSGILLWSHARDQPPRASPVLTRVTSDEGLTTDPALSPDGKLLAYASDRGGDTLDIWIQPTDGGPPVLLTKHPADDREPVFSADSSKVAFRSERDGGGVYVTSILGGEERLVVRKGRRPRFSPDGKWLAYWAGFSSGDPSSPGSNKIFIVPSNGGTPSQLAPQFESALYPVWSPDGKHVLFLGASGKDSATAGSVLTGANRPGNRMDWWIADLNQGAPLKTGVHAALIAQGLSVWASSGAGIAPDFWLPNHVLFSASFTTTNDFRDSVNIWSVPLSAKNWRATGPARQFTSGTAFESGVAVMPTGEIVFSSAEVRTGIWMLPLNANEGKITGPLKPLTRGAAFHGQPSATPDGSKLVYYATTSGNMDIWILDLHSGKESQLTFTPFGEAAPLISPDGSKVYYTIYGKRQVYSMAAQGGEFAKICEDCGTWNLSNDGAKLLYWYSTSKPLVSIGLVELSTARKVELIRHPQYSLYQPHFSPDDRWIAFLAKTGQDRSRIYITPFKGPVTSDTGEWIPVTDGENTGDKPRWSPDGNMLYFTSERDGFRCIWAQRLDRVTKHPVGAPFNVHHFHTSRRSLMNVGLGPLEISVTRNALVFNLGEITGNIWRAAQK